MVLICKYPGQPLGPYGKSLKLTEESHVKSLESHVKSLESHVKSLESHVKSPESHVKSPDCLQSLRVMCQCLMKTCEIC